MVKVNSGMLIFPLTCFLLLSACSAHSPFIITNTTDLSPSVSQNKYIAHEGKVFVTEQSLPEDFKYDLISNINVGKIWYGSSRNALNTMADRARQLGANAIIRAKTWHQPSGFSWAAPHGSGQAVWINDIEELESFGIKGKLY